MLIVRKPDGQFRKLTGIVRVGSSDEPTEDALVEVFDKPNYLLSGKPWEAHPQQKRLRACVTSADGKFCFHGLPSGKYEIRVSKEAGINITRMYIELDQQHGTKETIEVGLELGT